MLLQCDQVEKIGLFFGGQEWVPRMNSTLFLALRTMMIVGFSLGCKYK